MSLSDTWAVGDIPIGESCDMPIDPERPIADSYWVLSGRLLAGEYPGDLDAERARQKVRRLLEAGATLFLDLTEEGELRPYVPLLREEALARGNSVEHRRLPIRDLTTPAAADMVRLLDTVDAALDAGHVAYVHCWGGIGRTGTVVGCYLVRHGWSGPEALDEIARLRWGTPDGHRQAPETEAQRQMVLDWPIGR
jgi:protein-tyrosine phosphatase